MDCICGDEGADQSNGPGDQNSHIVGATGTLDRVKGTSGWGTLDRVPVWGPVVAWQHKARQTEWVSILVVIQYLL